MDFYGLSSIAPGWITVRNTVGQALVGMQANKAGLVKVLDVKWQRTVWQSSWETATRGWMNDIFIYWDSGLPANVTKWG